MEGLLTLLFLIGLLISWAAQQKKLQEKEENLKKSRIKKLLQEKEIPKKRVARFEDNSDLKDRHLKGVLENTGDAGNSKTTKSIVKISRLSDIKRAVIWAELLDKPIAEREL